MQRTEATTSRAWRPTSFSSPRWPPPSEGGSGSSILAIPVLIVASSCSPHGDYPWRLASSRCSRSSQLLHCLLLEAARTVGGADAAYGAHHPRPGRRHRISNVATALRPRSWTERAACRDIGKPVPTGVVSPARLAILRAS